GPHDAETPLVLALHGLTGSSSSHYILGLQVRIGQPPGGLEGRGRGHAQVMGGGGVATSLPAELVGEVLRP
ncbi:hypothetical protein QM291_31550, partial [Pseudomonas aeruginosa]|nr:hypothetical protein [Pseudomonas aeruginosa]